MFATRTNDAVAAVHAADHVQAFEELLGLRISLQRPLDLSAKLPVYEAGEFVSGEADSVREGLKRALGDLGSSLDLAAGIKPARKSSKPTTWEAIAQPQVRLEEHWKQVIDKWHARLNFGSEHVKSKLKVLNYSIWDQVQDILSNEMKVKEKSMQPLCDSVRIGAREEEAALGSSNGEGKNFDEEVYDDRQFYAMLLKTFIASSDASSMLKSLGAGDLAAMRKYKRKNNDMDRRASKGRKIRYTTHAKLQNFMFPIPSVPPAGLDVERLHMSLFQ